MKIGEVIDRLVEDHELKYTAIGLGKGKYITYESRNYYCRDSDCPIVLVDLNTAKVEPFVLDQFNVTYDYYKCTPTPRILHKVIKRCSDCPYSTFGLSDYVHCGISNETYYYDGDTPTGCPLPKEGE